MNIDLYNEINVGDIVVNEGFDEYFVIQDKRDGRAICQGIWLASNKIPYFKTRSQYYFSRKANPEETTKFHQHLRKHGYHLDKNFEFVTEF